MVDVEVDRCIDENSASNLTNGPSFTVAHRSCIDHILRWTSVTITSASQTLNSPSFTEAPPSTSQEPRRELAAAIRPNRARPTLPRRDTSAAPLEMKTDYSTARTRAVPNQPPVKLEIPGHISREARQLTDCYSACTWDALRQMKMYLLNTCVKHRKTFTFDHVEYRNIMKYSIFVFNIW
jgi:hypothetical protein